MLVRIPLIVACNETVDFLTSGFCFSVMNIFESNETVLLYAFRVSTLQAALESEIALIVM